MDPIIGASLIGAGTSLLSGFFSNSAQESANAANIQLARENRAWQEQMWAKQNEYNTPAAQIERMRAAGLNPALMYSQGNVGNAGDVGSVATPQVQPVTGFARGLGAAGDTIANAMMQLEQVKQMRAQTKLLQARAQQTVNNTFEPYTYGQLMRAKIHALTGQGNYSDSRTAGQDIYNRYMPYLMNNQVRGGELSNSRLNLQMYLDVAKYQLDVANYELRKRMTDAQADYYYKLSSLAEQKYNFLETMNPQQIEEIQKKIAGIAANTNLTNKEVDWYDYKIMLQTIDRVLKGIDMATPDMVVPMAP